MLAREMRDLAAISFREELGLLFGALEIGGEARESIPSYKS